MATPETWAVSKPRFRVIGFRAEFRDDLWGAPSETTSGLSALCLRSAPMDDHQSCHVHSVWHGEPASPSSHQVTAFSPARRMIAERTITAPMLSSQVRIRFMCYAP